MLDDGFLSFCFWWFAAAAVVGFCAGAVKARRLSRDWANVVNPGLQMLVGIIVFGPYMARNDFRLVAEWSYALLCAAGALYLIMFNRSRVRGPFVYVASANAILSFGMVAIYDDTSAIYTRALIALAAIVASYATISIFQYRTLTQVNS